MVKLCSEKSITAFVMDVVDLSFEKNSFDVVYVLNGFLHITKTEFPTALENVHAVLRPAGLFYLGMYGGYEFEGIWEDDTYTPKRYFSLYTDVDLKETLNKVFEIVYFRKIEFSQDKNPFQSVILKKRAN